MGPTSPAVETIPRIRLGSEGLKIDTNLECLAPNPALFLLPISGRRPPGTLSKHIHFDQFFVGCTTVSGEEDERNYCEVGAH